MKTWQVVAGAIGLCVLHALLLYHAGQPLIYSGGYVEFWHGVVLSDGNSQHLTDWYTFSHLIHGVLFYCALTFLFPRVPVGIRLLLSIGIEMSWELVENSDFIINRYREQALAQGYFGDSVINSVSDVISAIIGFVVAWRSPLWFSILFVIVLEGIALYAIRDNLTLNVIQLIHPIDAIGVWQNAR